MDRVFRDANVLFSAARSAKSRLREFWGLPALQLFTSPLAVEEARRNLALDRASALPDLDALIAALTLTHEPGPEAALPAEMDLPDKDRPIFLAAVAGQATHFVTGDRKHFGAYRGQSFASVVVCTPADYLDARGV